MKTKMVLGFLFSHGFDRVALIEKKKPLWQAGKLNGIGGKIEENESAVDAMCREFMEEAALETHREDWLNFATMSGEDWEVECFYTLSTQIDEIKTQTDEEVKQIFISELDSYEVIGSVLWLVPMAINHWKDVNMDKASITYKR